MKDFETVKRIEKEVAAGQVKPLYFLCGDEPYYINRLTEYLAKNLLSEEEKAFNQHVFYGKEVDAKGIMTCAKRFPMMSERMLVVVKEAQHLARTIQQFQDYFEKPNPSTVLIINYHGKALDKRTKMYKALQKNGIYLEGKKLYDSQMSSWILSVVSEQQRKISIKGAQMLADFLGTDLARCINELKKLFIVVPKEQEINDVHIEEHIGISKDFNNFELQNAVGNKNAYKGFKIAHYFAKNPKEHPLILSIFLLNNFFTKLFVYHGLKDKSPNNVAAKLGIPFFSSKEYQTAARNYPMRKTAQILGEIKSLDLQSKGVGASFESQPQLLKTFLFKVFS